LNSIKVTKMKCEAYRSIPTAYPRKHLFNEEINTGDEQDQLIDWANASSGINHSSSTTNSAKDTWYKYGDQENFGEFLFDKVNLPASRFTDGSFPVWYGAENENTSLLEIEFHLKNDVLTEAQNGYIIFERAMCLANIDLQKNGDLKFLSKSIPNYKEKASYSDCLDEFKNTLKQGATSIAYDSARNTGHECYAVTLREEILSSSVIKFYKMTVYTDPNKDTDVAEIILEE
jgi:hypothetical protein